MGCRVALPRTSSSAMHVYSSPYPPTPVPDESVYTNLAQTRFADYPSECPAFIDAATGKVITRGEWKDLTLSLAWGLRHELPKLGGVSLQRGDVAMIFSPNSIAWPITLFGGIAAGIRMTLANSAYTPRELEYQWTDSGAKAVLVHPALLPVVLEMFKLLDMDLTAARRRIVVVDWPFPEAGFDDYLRVRDLLGKGRFAQEEKFPGDLANETALLCYSSGTTGKPKGVMVNLALTSRQILEVMIFMWP